MSVQIPLTQEQREAIVELGSRGSGGRFDHVILSQLFTLGIVEIRSVDRRLVLTERGRKVFAELSNVQLEQRDGKE